MWICCHRSTEYQICLIWHCSWVWAICYRQTESVTDAMHSSFNLLYPNPSLLPTPPPLPATDSTPPPRCHLEVPHTCYPTYFPIFSPLTLIGSPTETAPYGSACGRWQHSPLQLHSHGLDPHSTGHQDRQGYGRFGIPLTSFAPIFTCCLLLFLISPVVQCCLLFLCWTQKPSALPDASPTVS